MATEETVSKLQEKLTHSHHNYDNYNDEYISVHDSVLCIQSFYILNERAILID